MKMELPAGYRLENVRENKTPELKEQIIQLWRESGAMESREQAQKRVEQVIFLVRDEDDRIVAVSTVFRLSNRQLGNRFYYFRCFISEAHRRSHLATNLIIAARDLLNQRFVNGEDTSAIGMLVSVENEILKKNRNHAIWPHSKFVYIGQNERGDHMRVYYFDDARIS
ncbi:MAG: hypothetical protein IH899_02935 [Planctomycetes bacterium]|nr:hypothetical protein [Planctomycetota bacterium]